MVYTRADGLCMLTNDAFRAKTGDFIPQNDAGAGEFDVKMKILHYKMMILLLKKMVLLLQKDDLCNHIVMICDTAGGAALCCQDLTW